MTSPTPSRAAAARAPWRAAHWLIVVLGFAASGCAGFADRHWPGDDSWRDGPAAETPIYQRVGAASWYGAAHQGRRTASGERFDENQLTAAHPTLPFGTIVRVTNIENGR